MFGYILFLVPMCIAFVWLFIKYGLEQALLDLIAFNLLFAFDFSALMPGNVNVLLLHLLLFILLGSLIVRPFSAYIKRRVFFVLLAAFIFVAWITLAVALNKISDWSIGRIVVHISRLYITNVLFIVVGLRLVYPMRFRRFAKIVVIGSIIIASIGIIQTATSGTILGNDERSQSYLGIFQPIGGKTLARMELQETTVSSIAVVRTIYFGGYSFYRAPGTFEFSFVILFFISIAGLCLISYKDYSRWLLVILAFSTAGFFAAFQRTTILAFVIVATVVLLVRLRWLLTPKFIFRALLTFFVVVLIASYVEPVSKAVSANLDGLFGERGSREVLTLNGRTSLWRYVISQIVHSPIIGTGQPITLYRAGWNPPNNNPELDISAHNYFLDIAYRAGIFPATILLVLFAFCVLRAWKLSRNRQVSMQERSMFFALAAALCGLFLTNLTGIVMAIPQIGALFWILCGYLAAYSAPVRLRNTEVAPLPYQLTSPLKTVAG